MSDSSTPSTPIILPPGSGEMLHAFGDVVEILLSGTQTGGTFTLWTEIVPPGGGPPPHRHHRETEWFLVLDGSFSFFLGDSWKDLPVGGVAYMPKACIHTFKNTGTTPGKLLISTSPSGFETFFARCAAEFSRDGGPDMGTILGIAAEFGIEFVNPA